MFWPVFGTIVILALAWAMRKAIKNTPFDEHRACTPDVKHLRHMEDKSDS